MRKILSIAILTFRESVRTKLVAALAAVVAFIVIGLPMLLKGDGTSVGVARMTLLYPLGSAFAFLAVAAPWTAAASLAADIKARTFQLVRVKPVRMWQLWTGKWLGLLLLDALLLFAAFAGVLARLVSTGGAESDEIRVAKRHVRPVLPSIERQIAEIEENVAATYEKGMTPLERRKLRANLRHRLPYATATLAAGETWKWFFAPEEMPRAGETVWLQFKFHSDALSQKHPVARVALGAEGDSAHAARLPGDIEDFSPREMAFALPAPAPGSSRRMELVVENVAEKGTPPLMVQPRKGLILMLGAGRIELNMLRAYAELLSILALLLAVGLALGSFFSLPVSVFAAACLVISVMASSYAVGDPDLLDADSLRSLPPLRRLQFHTSVVVTRSLAALSAPALRPAPLAHLSSSEWVPLGELLHALAGNGIALPLVLALLSSLHLARKELPE